MGSLQPLHDLAEQVKPILECLAIGAGIFTLLKWYWEWNNRATDVLLKLEEEFEKKCKNGRVLIENDEVYKNVSETLLRKVVETGNRHRLGDAEQENLNKIDDLLRF